MYFHRKEKDPLKPKHPMSAYILFTNDRRAALLAENKSVVEVTKVTAEEWKNMTEEQKRPYEEVCPFGLSHSSFDFAILFCGLISS